MKSYSEVEGIFTPTMISYMQHAVRIVEKLPDAIENKRVRCHEVARVVHRALKNYTNFKTLTTSVLDGKHGLMPHSFILLSEHKTDDLSRKAILDPYCVGRLPQVQLVSCMDSAGHLQLYKPGPTMLAEEINERDINIMSDILIPSGYGFHREW